MSIKKLDALDGDYVASGLFTHEEIAVIRWAEAVASNSARRDSEGFEALRDHFDTQQIVELTVIVAIRTMVNLIQEALWTDLEDSDSPSNDRPRVPFEPEDWFSWYLDDVLSSGVQRSHRVDPDGASDAP